MRRLSFVESIVIDCVADCSQIRPKDSFTSRQGYRWFSPPNGKEYEPDETERGKRPSCLRLKPQFHFPLWLNQHTIP